MKDAVLEELRAACGAGRSSCPQQGDETLASHAKNDSEWGGEHTRPACYRDREGRDHDERSFYETTRTLER